MSATARACAHCGALADGPYCCAGCAAAATLAGAPAAVEASQSISLAVPSISCGGCAAAIERALAPLADSISAQQIRIAERRIDLVLSADALPRVQAALVAAGHPATLIAAPLSDQRRAARLEWLRLGVAGFALMQGMMFTEALYWGDGEMALPVRDAFRWIAFLITSATILFSGWPFLRGAAAELAARRVGMDTLISTSVLLAYGASVVETLRGGPVVYYDAALMFIAFLLAARTMESRAVRRARQAIDALSAPLPETVLRRSGAQTVATPIEALKPGDEIELQAGEVIPVDGSLLSAAQVDESSLTGEPHGQSRRVGERVYSGSRTLGPAAIAVNKRAQDSTRAQLVRLASAALNDRPAWLASGERLAGIFTIAMLSLASVTFLVLTWMGSDRALSTTLAVLAASCPCALALALPAALAAAQSALARRGVLLKRGQALQQLASVGVVFCDKTGTLTEARSRVVSVRDCIGIGEDRALAIAAALERGVDHPLAHAFSSYDRQLEVRGRELRAGEGPRGRIDGVDWQLAPSERDRVALFRANDSQPAAVFDIEDALRDSTCRLVAGLKLRGIDVILASGDDPLRAHQLATRIGIDSAFGGLKPADKLALLRADRRPALMLGDGLNDAPVLAGAAVSMALGQGAGDAHRAADMVLLGADLTKVLYAIDLARAMRRIVHQNFAWAIGYHLMMLPLALAGWMPPWLAALGMAASSLLVTLNALRLISLRDGVAEPLAAPLPASQGAMA